MVEYGLFLKIINVNRRI